MPLSKSTTPSSGSDTTTDVPTTMTRQCRACVDMLTQVLSSSDSRPMQLLRAIGGQALESGTLPSSSSDTSSLRKNTTITTTTTSSTSTTPSLNAEIVSRQSNGVLVHLSPPTATIPTNTTTTEAATKGREPSRVGPVLLQAQPTKTNSYVVGATERTRHCRRSGWCIQPCNRRRRLGSIVVVVVVVVVSPD